jgi:hypothetical protein
MKDASQPGGSLEAILWLSEELLGPHKGGMVVKVLEMLHGLGGPGHKLSVLPRGLGGPGHKVCVLPHGLGSCGPNK